MERAVSLPPVGSKHPNGFLSLPRELRDLVYQELVHSGVVDAPPNPESAGPRLEAWLGRKSLPQYRLSQCMHYSADLYPKAACQGLLSSNRQIQAELRESQLALDYHLDIMVECFRDRANINEDRSNMTNLRVWPT